MRAEGGGGREVFCGSVGQHDIGSESATFADVGAVTQQTLVFQGVVLDEPDSIRIACRSDGSNVRNATLAAVSVGTVHQ